MLGSKQRNTKSELQHSFLKSGVLIKNLEICDTKLINAILALLVAKVNIPKTIEDFVNSPTDTWNSWTNSFVPWVQSQWATFTDWITQHFKK